MGRSSQKSFLLENVPNGYEPIEYMG